MDFVRLDCLLRNYILQLKDSLSHRKLPGMCAELGLPPPPPEEGHTKQQRIEASLQSLPQGEMPKVARAILIFHRPEPQVRYEMEEVLWADVTSPEIPKRYRHEVGRTLDPEDLYQDGERFIELLDRLFLFVEPKDVFSSPENSLKGQIRRHVLRNPGDWGVNELFGKLSAYDCSDHRFCLLLEGLAGSDVRPDEPDQRRFVDMVNVPLKRCAAELREVESDGGYPGFKVVSLGKGVAGTPKNLVFASFEKPDIRFCDAVNNDIEILTHADKVLVYDRPIGADGVRWRDLQLWWAEREGLEDEREAKDTLYRRLEKSLPKKSLQQQRFFYWFHRGFSHSIPHLPALLPEVWLHWDWKIASDRGREALLSSRMDFLMLLPANARVVVEVDGMQHYADQKGKADCWRYARTMEADRELRLAGYEVYRFGGAELTTENAPDRTKAFFEALFKRHGVPF